MKQNNEQTKLTTVKIIREVYSTFKQVSFDSGITLQKVVNRTLDLYDKDPEFRDKINRYNKLYSSGSQF